MKLTNILKKIDTNKVTKTETLYPKQQENKIINGIELPEVWKNLNSIELKDSARKSILEISKNTNPEVKAKQLGFKNVEHLMEICFNYILKLQD